MAILSRYTVEGAADSYHGPRIHPSSDPNTGVTLAAARKIVRSDLVQPRSVIADIHKEVRVTAGTIRKRPSI